MKDDIDVSVVVIVYNIEKYIKKCIDSIIKQTKKNIEIIIVDDESTDSSGKICDEYSKKYDNICTYHKKNGGPSSSRNFGLAKANGKYICFVDGDDFILDDFIENLYDTLEKYQLDIVVSNHFTYPNKEKVMHHFIKNEVLSGFEMINSHPCIHSSNDLNPVWRLMFRTELLKNNNISFNEKIAIGEDFVFNLQAFLKAEKVMAISYAGYVYNIGRQDSLMRNKFKISYEISLEKQYNFRKNKYGFAEKYDYDLYNYYLKVLYWAMIRNIINRGNICYQDIKRINNYDFIKDAKSFVKLGYKTNSLKEYILYLLVYFNCYHIIYFFLKEN